MTNLTEEKTENNFRKVMNFFSKPRKQVSDNQSSSTGLGLRRSQSLTSADFFVVGLEKENPPSPSNRNKSPSSRTTNAFNQQSSRLSRSRAPTPEKRSKQRHFDVAASLNAYGLERPGFSRNHNDSSGSSSNSSSNNTIDRYIDVEQTTPQQGRNKLNASYKRNCIGNGSDDCGRLPPRVQHPGDKPRSYSFRESKGTRYNLSSRDWMENGFTRESPRKLAKNVLERLSQSNVHKTSSRDSNDPITLGDVYAADCKSYSFDDPYETIEENDMELQNRAKEAEERVMHLSAELECGRFLQDGVFDVPALIHTIRNLANEKMHLALEVSGVLQTQMVERASAKEELRLAKAELVSQTHKLENKKNALQLAFEKDLDRKASDCSVKLERYKQEEQRLRDRVRELAEQNVSLQREVSCFREKDTENRSVIKCSEQQLKDVTAKNQALRQKLPELEDKYKSAEEDRDLMKRNFDDKARECRELHKSVARLLRTCSDQEKTIDHLRDDFKLSHSPVTYDKYISKLQTEQMRLIGVELTLRREVESYRLEADSLRRENISLFDRLKENADERGALTFRLDKEMWARISCLQTQGLSMLNESSQVSSKLLEFIKEMNHGNEDIKNGLDAQFIIESDIKLQGLKRGAKSLTRSLQTISALLHEKCNPVALKLNDQTSEDIVKSELKAESMLTNLLREKLYSKELEVEQLQAELAAAVRGNDILRFEVQNSLDNLSCVAHKLKDLELQMLKKDESVSRLQNSLQEHVKELTITNGILPKVSRERDMMWEEVKQYSEQNMLLNSEVNVLKKKIEALDEDILLREGEITILKDAIVSNTSFDLLASPDNALEYRIK